MPVDNVLHISNNEISIIPSLRLWKMNSFCLLLLVITCFSTIWVQSFHGGSAVRSAFQRSQLKMEYIPDGISKAQWEIIKKKEEEEAKKKSLGAVGITKFKSRSFEAWQKSGAEHLFPVDPKVPLEARPYMQRQGGSADGVDLLKKGIKPKDQAKPFAKTAVDEKYEQLEKEDKLRSYPFQMPWTSDAANKIGKPVTKAETTPAKKGTTTTAATKPTTTAKTGAKTALNNQPPPEQQEQPKKKFFGLF